MLAPSDLPNITSSKCKFNWSNIVYEYHLYPKNNDLIEQKNFLDRKLNEINKYRLNNKQDIPVMIGEFNMYSCENGWKYAINKFNSLGLNWCMFTYKTFNTSRKEWGLKFCDNINMINVHKDNIQTIENKIENLKFQKNIMLYDLLTYETQKIQHYH